MKHRTFKLQLFEETMSEGLFRQTTAEDTKVDAYLMLLLEHLHTAGNKYVSRRKLQIGIEFYFLAMIVYGGKNFEPPNLFQNRDEFVQNTLSEGIICKLLEHRSASSTDYYHFVESGRIARLFKIFYEEKLENWEKACALTAIPFAIRAMQTGLELHEVIEKF